MKNTIIIGMLVFAGIITKSCNNNHAGNDQKVDKVPVSIVRPYKAAISFPVRTSGILALKNEMKLSFKTGGIIRQIFVDEGQAVQKGQLLASLDLSEFESMVNQAKLGVDKAQRDLQRAENLYRDSVATLEQRQNAQTAVEFARSQLKIAEFNRQYSQIVAPANGKILKKLAETNEMIAPGHPLFLFGSAESDWILRTSLSDVDVVKVAINDSANVFFDAFPTRVYKTIVSEIAKTSDPFTGTYEIELRFIDKNPKFISGLIGKAVITPSVKDEYIVLPLGVIHEAEDMEGYIYLVRDSIYEKKRVKILNISDSLAYVEADISVNEKVIAHGAEFLNAGSILEIVE
jgi:RND family efflux transporter MFP subunit